MTTCPSDNDLLTVEQFAEKMKVSRTTVFTWLKEGYLQEGKHFFKIGRIIRFVWNTSLFLTQKNSKHSKCDETQPRPKVRTARHMPSQPAVNLDY